MRIPLHIARALPLVHVQTGCAGKHDICLEHVQLRERLVPLAYELAAHMLVGLVQSRVVGRGGQIARLLPTGLELVADGLEHVPVALVVGEYGKRGARVRLRVLAPAGNEEAQLHERAAQAVHAGAHQADENREQHAPRAGVYVQEHSLALSSNVRDLVVAQVLPVPTFEDVVFHREPEPGQELVAVVLVGVPLRAPQQVLLPLFRR